jgi:hypothetical protein
MAEGILFRLGWSAFSLLFVAVGVLTMKKGWASRSKSKRIEETETTPIRDLEPGTVEVKGTAQLAEGGEMLQAPFSRTDALATTVEVEEYHSNGEHGGSWDTEFEDQHMTSLVVDDGTGTVSVDLPPDGELNLELTKEKVSPGDEPSDNVRRFLQNEPAVEEGTRGSFGPLNYGDRRRYGEGVIEPGESVYVLGNARRVQGDWGERDYAIDEPTQSGDFVLSDKSEDELVSEGKLGGIFLILFGGVFAAVGGLFTLVVWVAM